MKHLTLLALFAIAALTSCNNKTAPQVKDVIDQQYDSLVNCLTDIPTNFADLDSIRLDSVANVLASIKWTPIADGGQLELEKKALYLQKKKDIIIHLGEEFNRQGRFPSTLNAANLLMQVDQLDN